MPKARKSKALPKAIAKGGREPAQAYKFQPSEVAVIGTEPPETPSPSLKRGIFCLENEGGWNKEAPFKCSTNNWDIRAYMEEKKNAALRKQHRSRTRSKSAITPPKTPIADLEIIDRRTTSGPAFYYTILKPGCDTIDRCPAAPPTPAIFKGFKGNRGGGGDFTIGDMPDYPNKKVETVLEIPESSIQHLSGGDDTIITAVLVAPTSLVSPRDQEVKNIAVEDIATDPPFSEMPLMPVMHEPTSTDSRSPSTASETIYAQGNLSTEPMQWAFGNKFGGVVVRRHTFVTDQKFQALQNNCQKLYDEFLKVKKSSSRINKEIKELHTRLQNLKTETAIVRRKSKRLIRRKSILLAKEKDTYFNYILQHIDRLIDLRKFIKEMDGAGAENGKLPTISDQLLQPLIDDPGFKFTTRKTRLSIYGF